MAADAIGLLSFTAIAAIGLLLAGWIGYPLALAMRALLLPRKESHDTPSSAELGLSCVIATREAPQIVRDRVDDVHACARTSGLARVDVVVALDRDAPAPDAEYRRLLYDRARVVRARHGGGKSCALDVGVEVAEGDVIALTDSAQRFAPGALGRLVERFRDPVVGAVSGRLCLPHDEEARSLLGAYWRYELWLRALESRVDSLVAVTGAVYAVRRRLWSPLPAGLICDDLFVPLHVVRQGFRVVHCDDARATDPRRFTREQELSRKLRTLTGMVQMCAWHPWILLPWRNRIWAQFVCHKLVRLATPPLLLVAVAAACAALALEGWLEAIMRVSILIVGGGLVLLDLWRPAAAAALVDRGRTALRLLASPIVAVARGLRGDWDVWYGDRSERARR